LSRFPPAALTAPASAPRAPLAAADVGGETVAVGTVPGLLSILNVNGKTFHELNNNDMKSQLRRMAEKFEINRFLVCSEFLR